MALSRTVSEILLAFVYE